MGITGTLTVSSYAQFQDINVDANQITTTIGNNNLELAAHGTGKIYVPSNDVQIDQNLTVNGTIYTNALEVTQPLEANKFTTGDITIEDNIITTTIGNNNLELRAAGTGLIEFEQFQVQENELEWQKLRTEFVTPFSIKNGFARDQADMVWKDGFTPIHAFWLPMYHFMLFVLFVFLKINIVTINTITRVNNMIRIKNIF